MNVSMISNNTAWSLIGWRLLQNSLFFLSLNIVLYDSGCLFEVILIQFKLWHSAVLIIEHYGFPQVLKNKTK